MNKHQTLRMKMATSLLDSSLMTISADSICRDDDSHQAAVLRNKHSPSCQLALHASAGSIRAAGNMFTPMRGRIADTNFENQFLLRVEQGLCSVNSRWQHMYKSEDTVNFLTLVYLIINFCIAINFIFYFYFYLYFNYF